MAFFNDLGRKLSQTGQTAVQKTKEVTEIAKLNSQISDEERRITDNYTEIGKLYASLHKDQPEEDYVSLFDAIQASEDKIAEYKQKISDIKGVKKCEKCGAEIPKDAAFCPGCGAPAPLQGDVVDNAEQADSVEAETYTAPASETASEPDGADETKEEV